jgi:hypothetical protein
MIAMYPPVACGLFPMSRFVPALVVRTGLPSTIRFRHTHAATGREAHPSRLQEDRVGRDLASATGRAIAKRLATGLIRIIAPKRRPATTEPRPPLGRLLWSM